MKNLYLLTLLTILLTSLSGCSNYLTKKSATEKRVDIIMGEMYKTNKDKEIVINDQDIELAEFKEDIVESDNKSYQDQSKTSGDNSQINTMYDGYGNKNESRCFENHPLVKCLILRTFANGQKQVFVFGQNGEIKLLPVNMLDDALTASADKIARAVGIFEGRRESPVILALMTKQPIEAVRPADSLQETKKTEEPEKIIEKIKPDNNGEAPQPETLAINPKLK